MRSSYTQVMGQRVAVLGASTNPDRYSHRAVAELLRHGHDVVPVSPKLERVLGLASVAKLSEIDRPIDTLTVYLAPHRSDLLADEILRLKPGRVIFNPGAENPRLRERLAGAGIPAEDACTLVLLSTNQF